MPTRSSITRPKAPAQPSSWPGYRQATLDCMNGQRPDLLVLKAFADTAARHNLPAEYPIAFLDAMAMDSHGRSL